jgi:cytochrome P450
MQADQPAQSLPVSPAPGAMPSADGLPVIGPLIPLLRNPLAFFRSMAVKKGPVFRIKIFTENMIVLSGTDTNRFMSEEGREVVTSGEIWRDLQDFWQCPHLIISMDGQPHMDERRNFKHYMSRDIANSEQAGVTGVIRACVNDFANGQAVSVRKLMQRLLSHELSYLFTGAAMKLPDELSHSIQVYQTTTLNTLMAKRYPRFVLKMPPFSNHEKRVHAFVRTLIARAKELEEEDSFFTFLLRRAGGDPERAFRESMPLFLLPFIAGLDTLASTLLFFLHEMVNNEPVLTRVVREVDEACERNGGEIPSPQELRKIPALFGVCSETMRRYPVAFGNQRTAAKDFVYKGYPIKAGEKLLFYTAQPHFDEKIFRDPDRFDIDRFLEPRLEQKVRYAFSPYGRGPHICLGAAMADSLFMTTVACLLRHFTFNAAKPGKRYKMLFHPGPTLPDGFSVTIRRRALPTMSSIS